MTPDLATQIINASRVEICRQNVFNMIHLVHHGQLVVESSRIVSNLCWVSLIVLQTMFHCLVLTIDIVDRLLIYQLDPNIPLSLLPLTI